VYAAGYAPFSSDLRPRYMFTRQLTGYTELFEYLDVCVNSSAVKSVQTV